MARRWNILSGRRIPWIGVVPLVLAVSGATASVAQGAGTIGKIKGAVSTYTYPVFPPPSDNTSGSDVGLLLTNYGNNSIGRITTDGVISSYTYPGVTGPLGITGGPDGALWFTNPNSNAIGNITTTGTVSFNTAPSVSEPTAIGAGPDGALWFTNAGNNSIGRITTAGVISNFTGNGISDPSRNHVGTRWVPVVHESWQQLDWAHHDGRSGLDVHEPQHRSREDRCGARRRSMVHQRRQQLDRSHYDDRSDFELHRRWDQRSRRDHIWTRWRVVVHQREQLDRSHHDGRSGFELHRRWDQRSGRDHVWTRRRCGSPTVSSRSGGSPPLSNLFVPYPSWDQWPDGITSDPTVPYGSRTLRTVPSDGSRPRAPFRRSMDLGSGDHGRLPVDPPMVPYGLQTPTTRLGGSRRLELSRTTTATKTKERRGLHRDPMALWFTNAGNDSIGRITTAGIISNFTGKADQRTKRNHVGTRWGPVVHQRWQQLDWTDHDNRGGLELCRP